MSRSSISILALIALVFSTKSYAIDHVRPVNITAGNCSINIVGNNNIIDIEALTQACIEDRVAQLRDKAEDGLSDFCIIRERSSLDRNICSVYFEDHESRYAFGLDEGSIRLRGRYTGEMRNSSPDGRGDFHVTSALSRIVMGFSDDNLYDAFGEGKTLIFDGNWRDGKFSGEGEIIDPFGGTMVGRFQGFVLVDGTAFNIVRRSLGLVLLFNGDRYSGPIRNGKLHGNGGEIITWTDRDNDGNPEFTLIERGEFVDGDLFDGERILRENTFGETVWIEKFESGNYVGNVN